MTSKLEMITIASSVVCIFINFMGMTFSAGLVLASKKGSFMRWGSIAAFLLSLSCALWTIYRLWEM